MKISFDQLKGLANKTGLELYKNNECLSFGNYFYTYTLVNKQTGLVVACDTELKTICNHLLIN